MKDACDTPGLTPLDDALTQLLEPLAMVTDTETVAVEQACGRVVAEAVISGLNIPPADNSAMDGYAVRSSDAHQGARLQQVGEAFAGHPFHGCVAPGECVRIMTGGQLPAGADCVVMQENVLADGEQIELQHDQSGGDNVRCAGEDIACGDVVFEPGRRLRAADIGLLSSLGLTQVSVRRRLKIALISTGDELRQPGDSLAAGQFYESNGYTLAALLQRFGAEVLDFGIVADDLERLTQAFTDADQQADVVITSGGVSVGEADHVKTVLQRLGEIDFWKLAIKPGKPFAFGRLPGSYFIGLPGNPVSALVTMHQLALPMLRTLQGEQQLVPLRIAARAGCAIRKAPGRTDFQRGICETNAAGELTVVTTGSQGSGVLTSMNRANCYIVLEQMRGHVEVGETVLVEPFDGFIG